MTEQEYINTTDLAKLRIVIKILHDITPANSIDEINDEFGDAYSKIYGWVLSLEKTVKTD